MLTSITVSIPPTIAGADFVPTRDTALAVESATAAAAKLDSGVGTYMRALNGFLLRSESVSSSKIERVDAGRDDFARAMIGVKASADARSTVAAIEALQAMVDAAGAAGRVELTDLLKAHKRLMRDDPMDAPYAGRTRDMQNWIGGSDYSPRDADYVPPPPELVEPLLADLLSFANRDDISVIAQAALAHAQFESIHPFTDGNGRIGRALISAVLRRRGLTRSVVVPVASAMLADTTQYFSLLGGYRSGDADPVVNYLAVATVVASEAAVESAAALAELPALWRDLAHPRKGSADEKIIEVLLDNPVLDADLVVRVTGVASSTAYQAMDRLENAGVVHSIVRNARDRAWAAGEVLDEIDRLNERVGKRLAA
jgi:Fic family protein